MSDAAAASGFPRLTYLRIKNYRALRDVELRDLTPLTVFIGPNGSGKSTVLDALAFLAEAVSGNLQQAWQDRNRFAGMRTRASEGPIEFEVGLNSELGNIRYYLHIDGDDNKLTVPEEGFYLPDGRIFGEGKLFKTFTSDKEGFTGLTSDIVFSDHDEEGREKPSFNKRMYLGARDISVLGYAFAYNLKISPYAHAIKNLIETYRYIHLTDDHLKGYSDAGPREKLSANGDNLPNVLYYLHTKHPEALARITAQLRRWVPGLADIVTEITSDERLLLRFKDASFEKPLPAQYMSEGTMRLAALLTLLYEPNATGLLGLEEPENELHPRLLPRLAEELIKVTETRQLLVATHSPFLLDALEPEQVWILDRGADGYTQATRTADIPQVKELVEDGSPLGYLWTSNFFRLGDPLAPRTSAAQ
ncbi:Predicted ATPase [Hymenobacter gelipurpurascens]|uniref:Predicted ATPase n=1 Tax=Hymenobacter gelipurpurascens TaxID=89968 RepID=A0A212UCN5_9BACT|nr:AAA family ATPase [Hymenobacter gelipurpurascens]SNC75953.1 Predicted ATPase [Hymenobacter gelipurpurascens]